MKIEALKRLLAEMHDLMLDSVSVEFDASGTMHVVGRKNGVVRHVHSTYQIPDKEKTDE